MGFFEPHGLGVLPHQRDTSRLSSEKLFQILLVPHMAPMESLSLEAYLSGVPSPQDNL